MCGGVRVEVAVLGREDVNRYRGLAARTGVRSEVEAGDAPGHRRGGKMNVVNIFSSRSPTLPKKG